MKTYSEAFKAAAPVKGQKKALRAYYAAQRGVWGFNPVTRYGSPNGKRYVRQATKREMAKEAW